ncbi:hypothetical protein JXX30_29160 (plasmid) [Rhodococcus erythropolis]|uniref:Uncharacterized protein n=2 Tax=Rhodococcus erythropolis group TaxID=2840174 RepID=A0A8I1D6W7_RHOER|nr:MULTISPECIES: hypothetical protein [Rhodococcus]MBH5143672.1 hypothetical protein [Rhodococcus erythropolis]MBO8149992.1 hypothetical protein [Rhodococcus erythropolis]MBS3690770.1 hypothetical protein [Rhodococcus qingshengii]MDO1492588.1 hypothetical protein [Rhodococcus erythropolis]MYV31892.1 hypothetical protein [Rhodococcus erythropolis]
MSAAEESDVAQARVFLALLNSEIDELSERIESALRLVRGARPVAPVLASAARTDAAALRKDLHRVHALVEQLVRRFPAVNSPTDVPAARSLRS